MALHSFMVGDLVENYVRKADRALDTRDPANWHHAYEPLGMGVYEIYEESHRPVLNNKILKHYWFHETCCDAVGRFAFFMDETLNLVMPYYNELYRSELLSVARLVGGSYEDVLKIAQSTADTRDLATNSTARSTGTASGSSSSNSASNTRQLDTPQAQFSLLDDNYLTTAGKADGTTASSDEQSSEASSTGTTSEDEDRSGKLDRTETRSHDESDPYAMRILAELGERFLNIDREIVNRKEIRECFYLVYDYDI